MIGEAKTVTGTVTATKAGGVRVTLAPGVTVDQGDIIETGSGASVGLVFIDKTVFSLGANARIVLDDLVFNANASDRSVFSVLAGPFSFLSGEIARTPEAMRVRTPVATIGVRGTTVGGNDQLIVLLAPDGHVGSIVLNGQIILDQENQALQRGANAPSFLSPDQVDALFGGILRLLQQTRAGLNPDLVQQAGFRELDGGAGFRLGDVEFRFFDQGSGVLGLEITGPLNLILDLFAQFFPQTKPEDGQQIIVDGEQPPVAAADGGPVTEAGGANNASPGQPTASGTLADNVSDPDGDSLAFELTGGGTYGVMAFNSATGEWSYTLDNNSPQTQALNAGETTTETFTYTVTDPDGNTATATITVTITGLNDNPTATDDFAGVSEAGGVDNDSAGLATVAGSLLGKVTDADVAGNLTDDLDFSLGVSGSIGPTELVAT